MSSRVGERRRSREFALQILYQLDMSPAEVETVFESFWEDKPAGETIRCFAESLAKGAISHQEEIDDLLQSTAHNWRISRMPVVDRNILRLALYEFLSEPETPRIVVIDEAIEIAKKFGNDDSSVFVNGVLDAVRLRLEQGDKKEPSRTSA